MDLGVLEAGGQVDNRYLVLKAATTLYGGQLLDVHLGAVPTYGQGRLTFGPHRPGLGKVKPLEYQVDVAGVAAGMSGLKFVGDAHLAMVTGEWVLPEACTACSNSLLIRRRTVRGVLLAS